MILRDRVRQTTSDWRRAALIGAMRLACCAFITIPAAGAARAADEEEPRFELHEFSLWGFDPTLEQANQLQHFPTTLPGVVDTDRSRVGAEGKVAPFTLMTFYGEPVKNLEIDLRVQSGRFVAHWPAGESKSGRLRWIDLIASREADKEGRVANVDAKHWFNAARELDSLFLRAGSRDERFIIYDAELKLSQPLQISGGPERYQLANLSKTPLYDLLVIAPEGDGVRVGRLAELPAAEAAAKPAESKPAGEKPGEAKPVEDKPRATRPARAAAAPAAAPAAGAVPVPTAPVAANPAEVKTAPGAANAPAAAKPEALVGKPVDVEMSAPLAQDSDELAAAKESLAENLRQQGLADKEVKLIMDRAAPAIFGAKELIVVCRLPADVIEEHLPLVTYPAAAKTVRVALVCSRNIDPKIKDEVKQLVERLADADYAEREAAEKRLLELGRLAVPALKAALKSTDPEVQFRAERLLLALNEKIEG